MGQIKDKTGEICKSSHGELMKVIEYRSYEDITVEFQDEYRATVSSRYGNFKAGRVHNPYRKKVCGVGYTGVGRHNVLSEDGANSHKYNTWSNMIHRAYDSKISESHPTYKGIVVCDKWHNFQSFGDWYDENYYEIEGEVMALDKDILCKNNKIYSPKTAIFVPAFMNKLVVKNNAKRGKYAIGVSFHKRDKVFTSTCNVKILKLTKSGTKHLGYYNTEMEAFQAYKEYKEQYIKQVADHYKDKIPQILYDALYRYEVEIND